MTNCNLTIKSQETVITISNIANVDFKIFQNEENTNTKSNNLGNTVTIKGEITENNCKELKKILDWSTNKSEDYREISCELILNKGEKKDEIIIRDYTMPKVFCVSYQEVFDKDKNKDEFVLKIKSTDESVEEIFTE